MRQNIDVHVCEVGMRDGLQSIKGFYPTAAKIAWLRDEVAAGVPEIEVCSFVPPKLIPQFQDAAEVCAAALDIAGPERRYTVSALIPNLKGAEIGMKAGVHKLNFVCSVSEGHNLANVRKTPAESVEQFREIVALREAMGLDGKVTLVGGLATSFGCSIEGRVDLKAVVALAEQFLAAGADELIVADTVGYANPRQVGDLFGQIYDAVGEVAITAHFHDTRGLGLANATAALEAGVRRFDASLAGLGGCPYAPGATGNIVMDDLVFMLEAMGMRTGVDLDKLMTARETMQSHLGGEPVHGHFVQAGAPKGFVPASPMAAAAE